jgi:hypothetical protein
MNTLMLSLLALLSCSLSLPVNLAVAAQDASPSVRVYGASPSEPSCCYSPSRIWQKTNSQSGWSVRRHSFDPYGFPERQGYQGLRPTPLPRGTALQNPWTMPGGGLNVGRDYGRMPTVTESNAEFFQPAPWHYPPPAGLESTGQTEFEPLGFTGIGDPYLTGLLYPGLAMPGLGPGLLSPNLPVGPYGLLYGPAGW